MRYKAGDKFIIEIETHYNHSGEKNSTRPLNDRDKADVSELYRVRGFKTLVFDEAGLDRLHKFDEMTAREYLEIKRFYCVKEFKEGGKYVPDLPDWCLQDFRNPENSINQIKKLKHKYEEDKIKEDTLRDIMKELNGIIEKYGIDNVRKAVEKD